MEGIAQEVERWLARAREARAAGSTTDVLRNLEEARGLAHTLEEDHPLRQVTSWRLAKAEFDFGSARRMLDALQDVLALDDPFAHYPGGLLAVDRLARRFWDEVGYGEPLILHLWDAAARAWERQGDAYLAAGAKVQQAWELACRGDKTGLRELLVRVGNLTPNNFGDGPHRHPRAPDAPSSVYWVQLDLGRTVLWASCWMRDDRLAWEAHEVFEDAAEGAAIERGDEVWYLDPALRAALTFGWPHRQHLRAWVPALERVKEPTRRAVHLGLARGLLTREEGDRPMARAHFIAASQAAEEGRAGPEWVVDGLVEALHEAASPEDQAKAQAVMDAHGVRAFVLPAA